MQGIPAIQRAERVQILGRFLDVSSVSRGQGRGLGLSGEGAQYETQSEEEP